MSVSRTINIRLLTNQRFSDLIKRLVGERWIFGLDGNIHKMFGKEIAFAKWFDGTIIIPRGLIWILLKVSVNWG